MQKGSTSQLAGCPVPNFPMTDLREQWSALKRHVLPSSILDKISSFVSQHVAPPPPLHRPLMLRRRCSAIKRRVVSPMHSGVPVGTQVFTVWACLYHGLPMTTPPQEVMTARLLATALRTTFPQSLCSINDGMHRPGLAYVMLGVKPKCSAAVQDPSTTPASVTPTVPPPAAATSRKHPRSGSRSRRPGRRHRHYRDHSPRRDRHSRSRSTPAHSRGMGDW